MTFVQLRPRSPRTKAENEIEMSDHYITFRCPGLRVTLCLGSEDRDYE